MSEYVIVIEDAGENYAAYAPDLPGCIAVGDSMEEVERLMSEAILFHIEGMLLNGEEVPAPSARVSIVNVGS
jgi:predicted RNase H-like HicB family nuclease